MVPMITRNRQLDRLRPIVPRPGQALRRRVHTVSGVSNDTTAYFLPCECIQALHRLALRVGVGDMENVHRDKHQAALRHRSPAAPAGAGET
jgi:hypothetical protein